jgi:CheY-like chemotaxis protein
MRIALVGDYEFEEAETVAEAIEVAERFKPDIVIRYLAADPALEHAGCVVVSAFAAEADQDEAREAGAAAFVSKPFDPDDLSATVASLLVRDR